MYDYDNNGIPAPGKTVWHGDKLYGTCDDCYKLVQLNKRGFGSMHVCLSVYERVLRDNQIASKETVRKLIQDWHKIEFLLRKITKDNTNMWRVDKVRIKRLTKKLNRKKYINSSDSYGIDSLAKLMKGLEKVYDKGYLMGSWITPETADIIGDLIRNVTNLLKEIKVS